MNAAMWYAWPWPWPRWQTSSFVAVAAFALYSPCVYPSIAGGDSGELIVSAHELGVAHPPGYPLWTLMSWLAICLAPQGTSAAYAVGQLNAFTAAAAVGVMHAAALRLSCGDRAAALVSAGLFGAGRLTWTWAVTPEVFALNNLLVAVLLLLLLHFEFAQSEQEKLKIAQWGAFASGLSLCNQHTAVVYVGVVAAYVLGCLRRMKVLSMAAFARLTAAFVAGLLPYIYLPFSAMFCSGARYKWGDQSTPAGLLIHLLRREYGTFDLGKDARGAGFLGNLRAYSSSLVTEFSYFGVVAAATGVAVSMCHCTRKTGAVPAVFAAARGRSRSSASRGGPKSASEPDQFLRHRPVAAALVVSVACYLSLFCWRANLDVSQSLLRKVTERFWMQANMVVAALAGMGFHVVIRSASDSFPSQVRAVQMLKWTAAIGTLLLSVRANYAECNHGRDFVVHDFADATLSSLPRDALVLTRGDLPTLTFRYLQFCEGFRPDLAFVDQELLSYSWYVPHAKRHLGKEVTFPGQAWLPIGFSHDTGTSFDFLSFLDANYGRRPMFACIGVQEHDSSWRSRYELVPYGVCHQFVRKGRVSIEWADVSHPYKAQWNYGHDSFEPGTWEKVANDEMWNAKITKAFFMYNQAAQSLGAEQLRMYNDSYRIYDQLVTLHSATGFPPFWHKNLALAAERLLATAGGGRALGGAELVFLAEKSAAHFETYASLSADDPQLPQILAAAKALRQMTARHPKR